MTKTTRISKKTFFAAALLGLAATVPANAYLFEELFDDFYEVSPDNVFYYVDAMYSLRSSTVDSFLVVDNATADTYSGSLNDDTTTWKQFVKTGAGTLQVSSLGTSGSVMYNLHGKSYTDDGTMNDPAVTIVTRQVSSGSKVGETQYVLNLTSSQLMTSWTSGEVVVDEGTLNLTGYVNTWVDFGTEYNSVLSSTYGLNVDSDGGMAGATRITVRNNATLSLSGGNNTTTDKDEGMVVTGSYTTFQFLYNLQSGDLGVDQYSTLYTGTSDTLHVDIHVDAWSDNTRTDTGIYASESASSTSYFDNALAFGGSIGILSGAASIYKTGEGDFTILGSASGFTGSLYAAGGELILAGTGSSESFSLTSSSDSSATVLVYTGLTNATSVNIAGTYSTSALATGGSAQGSAVVLSETYAVYTDSYTDSYNYSYTDIYTSIKESYFATPSAGTLVIAENQVISNFQSYFAAGITVSSGTTAAEAVRAAANSTGVLSSISSDGEMTGTSDAPIIAGTGIGSTIIIPGGNYAKDDSGNYTTTFNTDESGNMVGGVLVIDQDSGMGGVYEGSIVGCRVTIYNKTAFLENTAAAETTADLDNDARLEAVRVSLTEDTVKSIVGSDYTSEEISAFVKTIDADGSFALDTPIAWAVVNYYKAGTTYTKGDTDYTEYYYINYEADENVKGGLVVLRGAGDLALLLSSSNYSGIYIDADRTGKTVLNISAINTLDGAIVALGGTVSFVVDTDDTLTGKLQFSEGSNLVFSTADQITTVSGTILVGDSRKSKISFTTTQDEVYGNVYIERGVTARLTGDESMFPNATSLTIWEGSVDASDETAMGQLELVGDVNQVIQNLTGDSTAQILMSTGALTVNITDNSVDSYSALTLGTFDGSITGEGSLVKGGSGTFSLGGGENNRSFYGSVEVGEGDLAVTVASGLTGASALILDAGTTVALTGDQTLRNLFGAEDSSLTLTDGTLTLGSNGSATNGESRTLLSANLGTSTSTTLSALGVTSSGLSSSISRLDGYFASDGTRISLADITASSTQASATQAYLAAVAALAYSGYDASSAFESFAGTEDYAGTELISESDYAALVSFAEDGGRSTVVAGTALSFTLLGENYEIKYDATDTCYILSDSTGVEVKSSNVLTILSAVYGKLAAAQYLTDNVSVATSGTYAGYYDPSSVLRQFFSSTTAYNTYINGTFADAVLAEFKRAYGYEYPSSPTSTEIAQMNAILMAQISAVYEKMAGTSLEDEEAAAGLALLEEAGISVVGAFGAVEYDDAGNVVSVSTDWTEDLAYAGTLTTDLLVKTGDNTVTLTGTLTTGGIVVNGGTLALNYDTLTEDPAEGIAVSTGASLSIGAAYAGDIVYDGNGNEVYNKYKNGVIYQGAYDEDKRVVTYTQIYTYDDGAVYDMDGNEVYSRVGSVVYDSDGNEVFALFNGIVYEANTVDLAVSGTGNFVKTGEGYLILGDNVLYSGTTTIQEGILQLTLRNTTETDAGTTLVPQGDIILDGENVMLILAQDDEEVSWAGNITVESGATGAVEKLGEYTLTLTGDVLLGDGDAVNLVVSEGVLELTGRLTLNNSTLKIATGATLSVSNVVTADSLSLTGNGAFIIATGTATLDGASLSDEEKFTGTVTVGSTSGEAGLTLSGESVLDQARAVILLGETEASTLTIASGSDQTLQVLSSVGSKATVAIESSASLTLALSDGVRLSTPYSSGYYTYDDSVIYSIANFTGTVSGEGELSLSGNGASRFSGEVDVSKITVENGGQLILDVGSNDAFQNVSITVDGSANAGSEVVFYVASGAPYDYAASVSFASGGVFGKAGEGTLCVYSADSVFSDTTSVNVYEGTLVLDGLWTTSAYSDLVVKIAEVATVSVNIDTDTNVDFTQVYGSGTLQLTASSNASIIIGTDGKETLPTSSSDGVFFNGVISFDGSFDVTLAGGSSEDDALSLSAINTSEDVSLTISGYVEIVQAQNSELAGDLLVSSGAELRVVGTSSDSGRVSSSDLRRLSISADTVSVYGDSVFAVENVGLGLGAGMGSASLFVSISEDSYANTFFVELDNDASVLIASGTVIDIDAPSNTVATSAKLDEVSFIKNGAGTLTLTGSLLSSLVSTAEIDGTDGVFGLTEDVYRVLADNAGTLILGTEEGELVLSGLSDFSGTLSVDSGDTVDVEFVTLRSSVAATSGTLVIDSSDAAGTANSTPTLASVEADSGSDSSIVWQTLDKTITGGGNVEFSGDSGTGTLVSAAQEYYGTTTVSGAVEFSGDGRSSNSSNFTVANGGVLYGGVVLNERDVEYSLTTRRNMASDGTAGTATISGTLDDARLSSSISFQFELTSSGTIVDNSFVETGTSPAGVSISGCSYDAGAIVLKITDSAYDGEAATYTITIPYDTSSFPSLGSTASATGTATVAGVFTLESGGSVFLDLAAGDVISAGTVTVEKGASITLSGLDGASALGSVYTVVSATESAGTALTASVADALRVGLTAKYEASGYDGEVVLVAVYTNGDTVSAVRIVDDFSAVEGVSYNSGISGSFLGALSDLAGASEATNYVLNLDESSLNTELLLALNGISSDNLAKEVERLSPIGFASMLAMPVEAFNSDVQSIHRRLDQRRYDGANPLREDGEYEFFVMAQSSFTENGNGNDCANFDYNLYGVLAGYDWKPDFETTLGLAVGYTYGKAKIDNDGGKVKMSDMRLTAFGSRFLEECYIEGGVQFGWADFDTRRHTVVGTSRGDADALLGGAFFTVGTVYTLYENKKDIGGLYLTPTIGLSYMHARIDGFSESGTAGLDIDDADGDSLRLRIAAALQWDVILDDWRVRLGLEASYYHDFLGDELDIDGSFTAGGSSFGVSANALSPDVFSIGPTVDVMLSEKDSIFCGYGFKFDLDSGTSHGLNVGYRHRF